MPDVRQQLHEIVCGAKAAVLEEIHGPFAARGRKTGLQCNHFAHRYRKSTRYRYPSLLLHREFVGSQAKRLRLGHLLFGTPSGGVRERPSAERLLAWQARAESRLVDVRMIPQTHPLYGAR